MNKVIIEKIFEHSKLRPNQMAIADSIESSLTYGQFADRIRAGAKRLSLIGIKKDDKVMLAGLSKKEYVICYFAIHLLGAVAVPYEKHIEDEMLIYMINHVGAKLALVDKKRESIPVMQKDLFEVCSELYCEEASVHEADIADILFTTGTTGKPKGVVMTHKNIYCGAENVACGVEMRPEDVDIIVAPMNHAYAMGCLRAAMITGAAVVLHESCTMLKEMVQKIERYHCTGFSCVPATIKILYQYTRGKIDYVLGNMRYIELGSSSLDTDMKKELLKALPKASFYLNYGSTEAPRNIYMNLRKNPDKLSTIGKAAVNAVVTIRDEKNRVLPFGKENVGRLAIEGEMVMPCYWHNEEDTKQVLDGNRFLTNDIGYMDEDGFVYLMGRKSDVLNIGGELVSPVEIESVANRCGDVEESACISVSDEKNILGEKIVLFVQSECESNSKKEAIMEYLREHLDVKKMPEEIRFIKKLPTNYVGKLDRKKLLELL